MNEREFRLWTAVYAAIAGAGLGDYEFLDRIASRHADQAVDAYRERAKAATAKQYVAEPGDGRAL